jgi:HEAT repeat protein
LLFCFSHALSSSLLIFSLPTLPHRFVRKQAASSLGQLGGEKSLEVLLFGEPELCWSHVPCAILKTHHISAIEIIAKFIDSKKLAAAGAQSSSVSPVARPASAPPSTASQQQQQQQNGRVASVVLAPLSAQIKNGKTPIERAKATQMLAEGLTQTTSPAPLESDLTAAASVLLTSLSSDTDANVRASAAKALDRLLQSSLNTLDDVTVVCNSVASDPDEYVRANAAATLGSLHRRPSSSPLPSPSTARQVASNGSARGNGGGASGNKPMAPAAVVQTLLKALQSDSKWGVRDQAAKSFGKLGAATDDVLAALCQALAKDGNRDVRMSCARSLGELGMVTEQVGRSLCEALMKDAVGFVRKEAAIALGELAIEHEQVVDVRAFSLFFQVYSV